MPRLSKHSKRRLIERNEDIEYVKQTKRIASQAYISGKAIGSFQRYPKFFQYLKRRNNTSRSCTVRVYQNNIFIWRGTTKTLVTSFPIPDRFLKEMEVIDKNG